MATPAVAASETVPESVPPPGLVPIAMPTVAVLDVTVFPTASCTIATIVGVMIDPATVAVGAMRVDDLRRDVGHDVERGADRAREPGRGRGERVSRARLVDLAAGEDRDARGRGACGFAVHVSTAPHVPVPAVIASVTDATLDVTVFPNASCTVTFGCVAHTTPPLPPVVCCVTASLFAAPGFTVIDGRRPDDRRRHRVGRGDRLARRRSSTWRRS